MGRSWRPLLSASAFIAFLVLSRFSTLIPCVKVKGLEALASVLSASVRTVPFFIYLIVLAYARRSLDVFLEGVALNVLILLFKFLFNTPRPVPMGTPGYPSGHAARAFWLALVVDSKWRPVLLLYAALVAWSRVELCAHYPLDVVGGALLAVIVREVWVGARRGRGGPAGI